MLEVPFSLANKAATKRNILLTIPRICVVFKKMLSLEAAAKFAITTTTRNVPTP
jgi:hypothetical protein